MTLLLLLLSLSITAPATANTPVDCEEIYAVLMEFVEERVITYKEANEMLARCARAADF